MKCMLPKDPVILLSFVNTKLRDEFDSLEEFCTVMDVDMTELIQTLEKLNYHYDSKKNQFF